MGRYIYLEVGRLVDYNYSILQMSILMILYVIQLRINPVVSEWFEFGYLESWKDSRFKLRASFYFTLSYYIKGRYPLEIEALTFAFLHFLQLIWDKDCAEVQLCNIIIPNRILTIQ